MKRGSGCCAVDIYWTAASTSFSDNISYITYLFSEWRIQSCVMACLERCKTPPEFVSFTMAHMTDHSKFCRRWPLGSCKFGEHCVFAHSEEEIAEWRERHNVWKNKESGQKGADYNELAFQQEILGRLETAKDITEVVNLLNFTKCSIVRCGL